MKIKVVSQETHYEITYDEFCKKFGIPSADDIDFVDLKLDPEHELIILEQIEPTDVKRPSEGAIRLETDI